MSKFLCIPDIHGRNFWRKAIKENINKVNKVIFLGDYLDPYKEEILESPEEMECSDFFDSEGLLNMLNDIISLKKNNPEKYILLCGNHTCSYIWKDFNKATRTDYKNYSTYHNFFLENLSLFNLVYTSNDVIFSHAGISEGWANRMWESLGFPEDELSSVKEIAEVLRDTPLADFNNYYIKPLGDISHYRWGEARFGSCEWADIREHINHIETLKLKQNDKITKIVSIGEEGIYQVFGHTQLKEPLITDKWACLDCKKGFIIDTISHEITEC